MIIFSLILFFPVVALANQHNGQQKASLKNNRKTVGRYAKVSKQFKPNKARVYIVLVFGINHICLSPILNHFPRSATKLATINAHG
jgi:hypothetical protein